MHQRRGLLSLSQIFTQRFHRHLHTLLLVHQGHRSPVQREIRANPSSYSACIHNMYLLSVCVSEYYAHKDKAQAVLTTCNHWQWRESVWMSKVTPEIVFKLWMSSSWCFTVYFSKSLLSHSLYYYFFFLYVSCLKKQYCNLLSWFLVLLRCIVLFLFYGLLFITICHFFLL